jgi:serine/threonine protein kinase
VTAQVGAPDLPGLRYLEPLGSGGFSDVYLYERDQPRIKVAVKLMKADVLDDVQRRQFVAEADTMAELAEHPFIVPVLGAGTSDDGRPYLVMRYYPPPDLGERVAASPMSVPDALRTGIQLASAIETAHRSGIIHRDIKPGNVLVSSYGVPGLSDFGIAGRAVDTVDEDEHLGVSMPWSPPEVLSGASNGSATSDVYSLAATVWNLLVGRSPFTIKGGDNSERAMFTRILHSKPPVTGRAEVPGSLDRLLQQAMSKNPAHRPQSAMELARHLQRVEQELRLARTEIVVLDARPDPAPVSGAASPADAPPLSPEGGVGQTVARSRHGFAPPSADDRPLQPPEEPIAPMPAAPPPTEPPPAAPPTARRTPKVVDMKPDATVRRPRQVSTPHSDQGTPAAAGRHAAAANANANANATVRRPRAADPNAGIAGEPTIEEGSGGSSRRPVALVAAVLIVVVVAVGALLGRGGDTPEVATKLPNGSDPTDASQALGGGSKPSPPRVTATVSDGKAVFTWPQDQTGDSYYYEQEGVAGQQPAGDRRIVLPLPRSGRVCVAVYVVRDGERNKSTVCKGAA